MNIEIEKDRKVGDIQNEFNKLFPYLKIEFYYFNNAETFRDENIVTPTARVGIATQLGIKKSLLEFGETTTVKEFEAKLKSEFGLFARLFRKSGRVWLPAEFTSGWSLKLQNEHGEATSFSAA